jgi:hypothetical protein
MLKLSSVAIPVEEWYLFRDADKIENKTFFNRHYVYVHYPECVLIYRFNPGKRNYFDRYETIGVFRDKKFIQIK